MSTELEIAWAAGLFEGEGCITFSGKNSVSLVLSSTDRDVIDKFAAITTNQNKIGLKLRENPDHKTAYVWNVAEKNEVIRLLTLFLPWLHDRRKAKAEKALERLGNNKGKNLEITHGTSGGAVMERRRGIPVCDECKIAWNKYKSEWRASRREAGKIAN